MIKKTVIMKDDPDVLKKNFKVYMPMLAYQPLEQNMQFYKD